WIACATRRERPPGIQRRQRDAAADEAIPVRATAGPARDDYPRACRRALRIRSGVIGWRVRRTPNGASASFTAFRMAPGAPAVPASAIPLNPPTVNGDGVSR